MAIQKKLLHFNDKSNFEILLERGNILDTSIVFIKNTKLIWTHGLYYDSVTNELLDLIPTLTSQLTNDSGFITNSALDSYYTKTETLELVNTKIQEVVGAAPEALDTLEEIAAKLNEDSDAIDAINGVLTGKATKEEVNNKVSKTGDETIDGNKTFSNDIKVGTNKVWHEGNDGPGSGLDADTLDGLQATDFITDRMIGLKQDYEDLVILLWKDSGLGYHLLKGSLYTFHSGAGRHLTADVDIWLSRWRVEETSREFYATFNSTYSEGMRLVTCTYNGEKWYAIKHTNPIQACVFKFAGIAIAVDFTVIVFYNSNTSTILNEEIYNSILNVEFDQYISNKILPIPTSANNGNILQVINGKYLLSNISLEDLLSYGVEWDINVADPHLTRIGNMNFHRTLPILSGMKGCIALGGKVIYWLDKNDWRFKANRYTIKIAAEQAVSISKNTSGYILNSTLDGLAGTLRNVVGENVTTELTPVTLSYYIKINGIICKVNGVGYDNITSGVYNNLVLLTPISGDLNIQQGETMLIELGSRLWGIDGEVKVYVPEFWIKSEIDGDKRRVRITTMKINNTWTHLPALLVGAYRSAVLNTVPLNMGYLSTLPVNSAISVVNTATYCRGGGNNSTYDLYLETDPCRTGLGKPRTTGLNRATMRTYARNAGSYIMSYDQYKNIMYWLYVVEYANFNSLEAFNAELTTEGYHQGGMGLGVTNWNLNLWIWYSGNTPITPCGYLNEFGNGTGIKTIKLITPTASGAEPTLEVTFQVPRWRGFDNPFGDIWTNLDGIIIDADADNHPNNMNYVYTCQDPDKFGETLTDDWEKVGEEIHLDGYTKLFNLGGAAHIIPNVMGGNTTQYKCDHHYTGDKNTTLRALVVGGSALNGASAGLGLFDSIDGVSHSWTCVGFRTVSPFVSSQATETV